MYYIDSPSFSTATAVFTDELLTIKAPDGFYKFETSYREQLDGLLLNNIECTECIDCKQLLTVNVKIGAAFTVKYIDCWGYDHVLEFPAYPGYVQGQLRTIDLTDSNLCVKNGSATSNNAGLFNATYGISSSCDITTNLIQSGICDSSSETPNGCDIICEPIDLSSHVYILKTVSTYLENGMIAYSANNTVDVFVGDDMYYKINYNNRVYGVRIDNSGVISELTYCNP